MRKRQEITDPKSCLNKALINEPIFVLRAKDPLAADVVRHWAALAHGVHDLHKREEARALAAGMDAWRAQYKAGEIPHEPMDPPLSKVLLDLVTELRIYHEYGKIPPALADMVRDAEAVLDRMHARKKAEPEPTGPEMVDVRDGEHRWVGSVEDDKAIEAELIRVMDLVRNEIATGKGARLQTIPAKLPKPELVAEFMRRLEKRMAKIGMPGRALTREEAELLEKAVKVLRREPAVKPINAGTVERMTLTSLAMTLAMLPNRAFNRLERMEVGHAVKAVELVDFMPIVRDDSADAAKFRAWFKWLPTESVPMCRAVGLWKGMDPGLVHGGLMPTLAEVIQEYSERAREQNTPAKPDPALVVPRDDMGQEVAAGTVEVPADGEAGPEHIAEVAKRCQVVEPGIGPDPTSTELGVHTGRALGPAIDPL